MTSYGTVDTSHTPVSKHSFTQFNVVSITDAQQASQSHLSKYMKFSLTTEFFRTSHYNYQAKASLSKSKTQVQMRLTSKLPQH